MRRRVCRVLHGRLMAMSDGFEHRRRCGRDYWAGEPIQGGGPDLGSARVGTAVGLAVFAALAVGGVLLAPAPSSGPPRHVPHGVVLTPAPTAGPDASLVREQLAEARGGVAP